MDIESLETRRSGLLTTDSSLNLLGKSKIRRLVGNLLRNRSLQLWMNDISKKEYVNIGAGGNIMKGFINIDYLWRRGMDLCWDITKKLPLESDSVKGVFTEHTLEHFIWEDAVKILLPEMFRILKRGGTIRISVPDAEAAIANYWKAREEGATDKPWRASFDGGSRVAFTPMITVNNVFRQIYAPLYLGHKFAYDFQTLEYFLHLAGFVDIKKETYLHGRDEALLVDYKKRAGESLYIEASKPL